MRARLLGRPYEKAYGSDAANACTRPTPWLRAIARFVAEMEQMDHVFDGTIDHGLPARA
jgi:hypothetical protein